MKNKDAEIVDRLKNFFLSDIDSVRTLERIITFQDLVQVLHDRDVLHSLLGRDYDVNTLGIDELIDAVEGTAVSPCEIAVTSSEVFPGVSSIICNQWTELAPVLNISVESCLEGSADEPEKKLLELFHSSCGRVCNKEAEFRLLRALRKGKRLELLESVTKHFQRSTNSV